jgi:hypothetical protein
MVGVKARLPGGWLVTLTLDCKLLTQREKIG